jgi:hypothetical protein
MNEGKIKGFPQHMLIHHCKEFENHELSDTVLGTIVKAHPFRKVLLQCREKLDEKLKKATDAADADRAAAIKENINYVDFPP